ncbi:MAG: GGDEF domain-containing protein [Moritella sp.]|uniref:GGDEF domain-containing protein n=1 Tax=Moritella sp. TaxID=78556 RepID=UPI0029A8071C|nr:GGDEF domain-containing protein [Moritella sp.]MDX2322410.1 GGDEF domain-containing protein [Moritella sp.]
MTKNVNKLTYSVLISIFISLVFVSLYAAINYNKYFHRSHSSFTSRVNEVNANFDNYGYILNLVTDLWDVNAHKINSTRDNNDGRFLHHALEGETEQGVQVLNFMNSLDLRILKKLNDSKIRPFVRSIDSNELIALMDFSDETLQKTFKKERCIETDSCGENTDEVHYSNVHNTLIDDKPSVIIMKRLKGTSFYIMLHMSLEDMSAFSVDLAPFSMVFEDKPFKYIELYSDDYTSIFNRNTDVVFFHESKFGYLITERHALLAPIQSIIPLFIVCWLFLAIIFYMLLHLNLKNALIREKTVRSITDKLTGVYNRDFIELALMKEGMLNGGGTVIYLDGNKIKMINDKFGHDYGDIAIKMICDAAKSCIRKEDYIIRMGGDEFVVVLKGCNESAAYLVFDKIAAVLRLQSQSKLPFIESGVSVDPGYCEFTNSEDFESAITKSDLEMLKQKDASKQGRK